MAADISCLGRSYAAGLTEVGDKCQSPLKLANHLGKISARIGLDKCQSLLSIGPGPGLVDVPLIRDYLPDLKQYYGVELRPDALQELRQWIQKDIGDRMECELIAQNIEDWSGPPDGVKVDVILIIHVLHYTTDKQSVLKKCLNWMKPGGLLIILIGAPEGIFPRSAEYVNPESCQSYTSVHAVEDLHAVGIHSWIEERIPNTTDVRNPKKILIDFILQKEATAAEVEKFKDLIKKFAPTGFYYEEHQLFIITK